jgi:tRNA_anti-like
LRKKKKKYANVIMLLLILFVLFYVVLQDSSLKVSAKELTNRYSSDITEADKKFSNNEIALTGKVKSYFEFEGKKSLIQLDTGNSELQLYCILMNIETEEKASSLTAGSTVTVLGKCLGIKDYKFPNSIYIEAEEIK